MGSQGLRAFRSNSVLVLGGFSVTEKKEIKRAGKRRRGIGESSLFLYFFPLLCYLPFSLLFIKPGLWHEGGKRKSDKREEKVRQGSRHTLSAS